MYATMIVASGARGGAAGVTGLRNLIRVSAHVLQYEEFFSYPLAVLALLEGMGISSLYSERKDDPEFKRRFKKERRAKVDAVLAQML